MNRAWLSHAERSNGFWLWIIRTIAHRLGRVPARLLLYPITLYFVLTAHAQRRASMVYLSRVLGRPATLRDAARHIHTFASTLVDRVYLFTGQQDRLDLKLHNHEVVLKLIKANRTAILLGSHLGSFEVLRALGLLRMNLPLKILMYKNHNKVISQILNFLDANLEKSVIELGQPGTTLEIHESLANGFFVGMLGDRPGENDRTTRCTILGGEVDFPAGPILLAHACKVPVVLFFGIYRGGNRYDIYFESLADQVTLSREHREEEIQQWMQRYAERLEFHTRDAPFNWFNFYDFWDDFTPPA